MDSRAHTLSDGTDSSGIVQERYVLFPRDSNHYPQAILLRQIENPAGRHRVKANGIDAVCRHLREIPRRRYRIKLIAGFVRLKRAVRNSTNVKFLVANKHELAGSSSTQETDGFSGAGVNFAHIVPPGGLPRHEGSDSGLCPATSGAAPS